MRKTQKAKAGRDEKDSPMKEIHRKVRNGKRERINAKSRGDEWKNSGNFNATPERKRGADLVDETLSLSTAPLQLFAEISMTFPPRQM